MFSLSIYIPSFPKNWKPVPPIFFVCCIQILGGNKQRRWGDLLGWELGGFISPLPSLWKPLSVLTHLFKGHCFFLCISEKNSMLMKFLKVDLEIWWDIIIIFFNIQVEKWAFKMKQKRVFRLNVDHTQRIFFSGKTATGQQKWWWSEPWGLFKDITRKFQQDVLVSMWWPKFSLGWRNIWNSLEKRGHGGICILGRYFDGGPKNSFQIAWTQQSGIHLNWKSKSIQKKSTLQLTWVVNHISYLGFHFIFQEGKSRVFPEKSRQ